MEGLSSLAAFASEWGTFALSWVSAVAAIASGFIAWKVYRSQSSPDLIAYVDMEYDGSPMACLFVRNIGSAPAYDVSFSLDGDGPSGASFNGDLREFAKKEIPMLPPGAKRMAFIGLFHEMLADDGRASRATMRISYRDARRRGYSGSFPIEVDSFACAPLVEPLVTQRLREVDKSIQKLNRSLKGIERVMGRTAMSSNGQNDSLQGR